MRLYFVYGNLLKQELPTDEKFEKFRGSCPINRNLDGPKRQKKEIPPSSRHFSIFKLMFLRKDQLNFIVKALNQQFASSKIFHGEIIDFVLRTGFLLRQKSQKLKLTQTLLDIEFNFS